MSLLDPKWKYTHSTATDIRKTFGRVRRELKRQERERTQSPRILRLNRIAGMTEGSQHD